MRYIFNHFFNRNLIVKIIEYKTITIWEIETIDRRLEKRR